jgi:hypothetical protein
VQGRNSSTGKLPRGMCAEPVLRPTHGAGGRGWSIFLPFNVGAVNSTRAPGSSRCAAGLIRLPGMLELAEQRVRAAVLFETLLRWRLKCAAYNWLQRSGNNNSAHMSLVESRG